MEQIRNRYVDLSLLAVALVWGSSYLAAKGATAVASPLLVLFVRYALTALGCLLLAGLRRPGLPHRPRRTRRAGRRAEVRLGLVLGVTQCAVLVLETYGVAHTSAANAGVLISLTIVIAPVLERSPALSGSFFAAVAASLAGVLLLVSGSGLDRPGLGDVLVLLAALVRGAHVVLLGRLTAGRDVRALPLTAVQSLVGAGVCGVAAGPRLGALTDLSTGTWATLAYLALACGVFAFLVQTWAVRRTSASRACLMLGTEPVWALVTAVLVGGEHLSPVAALGAVLVIGGTYRAQAVERQRRVPDASYPSAEPDCAPAAAPL